MQVYWIKPVLIQENEIDLYLQTNTHIFPLLLCWRCIDMLSDFFYIITFRRLIFPEYLESSSNIFQIYLCNTSPRAFLTLQAKLSLQRANIYLI